MNNADSIPAQLLQNKTLPADQRIIPGDMLSIIISARHPEAVAAFNKQGPASETTSSNGVSVASGSSYLVDNNGNIDFPIIGKLSIGGLTKSEVEGLLKSKIYPEYVTEEPFISIRVENYKISILGEVKNPSVYQIPSERISVLEAIAMAGDLTITGRRDNVMLIRFKPDGTKEIVRLNLNDANLLFSPYFYMQQNDLIYVQPNRSKAQSATIISPVLTFGISIISSLVSITTLIVTLTR